MSKLSREIRHLQKIMDEREVKYNEYNRLTREEVSKALVNTKDKFAEVNEFRLTLKDQQAMLASKESVDRVREENAALRALIATFPVRSEFDALQAKASRLNDFQIKIMTVIGVAMFLMPVIFWLINKFIH